MSSGTQIDLDVLGTDAGQGGAATPPASGANGAGAGSGVYPTDEEILGIEPVGAPRQQRDSSGNNSPRNENMKARLLPTAIRCRWENLKERSRA